MSRRNHPEWLNSSKSPLIIVHWHYAKWLSALDSAGKYFLRSGASKVSYLDISQYSFPRVGSPQNSLFVALKLRSPLDRRFESEGYERCKLAPVDRELLKRGITSNPLSVEGETEIRVGVNSQSVSFFRNTFDDPNQRKPRFVEKFERKNEGRAISLYLRISALLSTGQFDHVVLSNGRFAAQRACAEAAKSLGIDISYLELDSPNTFIWERYPIHDREAMQSEARKFFSKLSKHEIREAYEAWKGPRTGKAFAGNDFAGSWRTRETTDFLERISKPYDVFFTSSKDEFEAVGPQWWLDEWGKDQYAAFVAVLKKKQEIGDSSRSVIRVHPNLQTKSSSLQDLELEKLQSITREFPEVFVIGPKDPVNSYDLVKLANRVFVSNSTIGLEASALGKPVFCSRATRYDIAADVKRIHSQRDLTEENLRPWAVDTSGAQGLLAYWHLRGYPLLTPYSAWEDVDPIVAPLRTRTSFLPGEISIGQMYYFLKGNRIIRPTDKLLNH